MALPGISYNQSNTESQSYLPIQADWLTKALQTYGPTLGQNQNVYQGQRVADLSGVQQGVLDAASSFLSTFGTPQQVGTPLSDETGETIKGLLTGQTGAAYISPEQTERYYKQSIYDPTVRAMKETVLPGVDENYAGGNFFGSGRQKAKQRAAQDTAEYLSGARSDLDWNVLEANRATDEAKAARALSAVPTAMQYGQQPAQEVMNNLNIAAGQIGGLNDLFGIGQQGQTQEQREIEAAIAKYAEENQITDPSNLAILLSLVGQTMSSAESSGFGFGLGFGE